MIELEYIGAPPARPQTATLSDYYAESLAEEPESGGSKFWMWTLVGLAGAYYFLGVAPERKRQRDSRRYEKTRRRGNPRVTTNGDAWERSGAAATYNQLFPNG